MSLAGTRAARDIGSTNLDNRSFALNDELNVTFFDRHVAKRLTEIFRDDLRSTRRVTGEDRGRAGLKQLFYAPLLPLRDQR